MTTRQEALELLEASASMYRFLSQALFRELNEAAIEELAGAQWPSDTGNAHLDHGYYLLKRYFTFSNASERRRELAVEYARVFLAAGVFESKKRTAVPYESVFTDEQHLVMGASRDEVVRWFREDGFAVDPDLHEPEDHIAFEFEYIATMSERAKQLLADDDAAAFSRCVRRTATFAEEHLLSWIGMLRAAAGQFARTTFYTGLLEVAEGTLEQGVDLLRELQGCVGTRTAA